MEKKCTEIGLYEVHLHKDSSAFLVVFSEGVSSNCQCSQGLMQALKTTGESYINEFKATNRTLPICHATVTGKVCKKV